MPVGLFTGRAPAVRPKQPAYYVATDGNDIARGDIDDPWSIEALATPGLVPVGSTIYLRAGTYTGRYVLAQNGRSDAKIVITNYPGELVTIDQSLSEKIGTGGTDSAVRMQGSYQTLIGNTTGWLVVMNSGSDRSLEGGQDHLRPPGVYIDGPGNVFRNLLIHDIGNNVWTDSDTDPDPLGVRGNVIWCCGHDSPDLDPARGRDHTIYMQRQGLLFEGNISSNTYSIAVQVYSTNGNVSGCVVRDDVSINSEAPTAYTTNKCNVTFGAVDQATTGIVYDNSCSWRFLDGVSRTALALGAGFAPNGSVSVTDCLLHGTVRFDKEFTSITFLRNWVRAQVNGGGPGVIAAETWQPDWGSNVPAYSAAFEAAHPDNTYSQGHDPAIDDYRVYANKDESGRAHVCVFNAAEASTVDVDLSSVCTSGVEYAVYNAENMFQGNSTPTPIGTFTYSGADVPMPMATKGDAADPIGGGSLESDRLTGIHCGAFVIRRAAA